jgi:glutamine transport system substrate-binding protein
MGTLRVGVVVPVPPFTGMDGEAGLDIDLMTATADALGDRVEFVDFGDNDAVFSALKAGDVDCAAGGLTVSAEREQHAAFIPPYLITGQALAVDAARHPQAHSVDGIEGLTIAVQQGSTAESVAEQLVARGRAGSVKRCTTLDIEGCDAVMALGPTLTELAKHLTGVDVVQKGLTVEHIAIAVAEHDQQMLSRITVAQAELEDAGTLQQIRRKWLGNPYADQSLAVH